jgi:hypothetical protein
VTQERSGHPLPESPEARQNEVPEDLEGRKGEGDDGAEAAQTTDLMNPDGEPYEGGDLGRGPPFNQEKKS